MPESVIIHFRENDTAEIIRCIERKFIRTADQVWELPAGERLLALELYLDFDSEYEAAEKEEIIALLGGDPTISFGFDIRRSNSDEACDELERFLKQDLAGLNFVLDNNIDRIISASSMEHTADLLNAYRYRKDASVR